MKGTERERKYQDLSISEEESDSREQEKKGLIGSDRGLGGTNVEGGDGSWSNGHAKLRVSVSSLLLCPRS